MGDILTTAFFSPSKAGRVIWNVGPAILLPTATDNALGSEKFGIGPSVVLLAQPRKWTLGLLFTGNWNADETWTAPLLFQVSKVTLLGKRPVNLAMAAGPMIASPDGGASWRFRMAATFLFPR